MMMIENESVCATLERIPRSDSLAVVGGKSVREAAGVKEYSEAKLRS